MDISKDNVAAKQKPNKNPERRINAIFISVMLALPILHWIIFWFVVNINSILLAFQTYNPEYYALESAKSQNYLEFYEKEIIAREEFDYPPFSQMIRLVLSGENNFRVEKSAQEITLRLCTMIDKYGISERLEILGPTNCVIERINGLIK